MLTSLPRPTFILLIITSIFVLVTLSWMLTLPPIRRHKPSIASTRQHTFVLTYNAITPPRKSPSGSCTYGNPQRKVVFLKTHKTGSTTVASIIQRYGYTNNLTFLVPDRQHFVNYQNIFSADQIGNKSKPWERDDGSSSTGQENAGVSIPSLKNVGYDVLTNHARYQRREMDRVFQEAKYVTILREPSAQFESAFYYFEIWRSLPHTHKLPLLQFLEDPKRNFDMVMSQRQYYKDSAHNQQLYDLGMEHDEMEDEAAVKRKIHEIDSDFDLVMITEYFDESLILLRRLLCWRMDDIVYLAKSTRSPDYRMELNETLRARLRRWNRADTLLYNHFNKTFWKRVASYGPDFARDLALFRRKLSEASNACCNASRVNAHDRRVVLFSLRDNASNSCRLLAKGDVDFTRLIRERMKANGIPMYKYRERNKPKKQIKTAKLAGEVT